MRHLGRETRLGQVVYGLAFASLLATGCGAGSAHHPSGSAHAARAPTASPITNPWMGRHVVAVTHNGGQYEFPQDTMFALDRARALGMQVLDVDVQMSKDHIPVLIHSETLDSSTNGHGDVSGYTAEQLGQLDAAYQWIPGCGVCRGRAPRRYADRGVRTGAKALPPGASSRDDFGVPTLNEVFAQFPHSYLDVELKPQSDAAIAVAALIHRFHREALTIVASSDDAQVRQFRALAPTVAISPGQTASTSFALGSPIAPGFQILQLPYRYEFSGREITVITPTLVKRAHAAGLALWDWDQGAPVGGPLYRTLIGLGVDGILASSPTDLLSVLRADHDEWSSQTQ